MLLKWVGVGSADPISQIVYFYFFKNCLFDSSLNQKSRGLIFGILVHSLTPRTYVPCAMLNVLIYKFSGAPHTTYKKQKYDIR